MHLLIVIGAGIFVFLGLTHASLTLRSGPEGGPMTPTDPVVRQAMTVSGGLGLAPSIDTTLWRAWAGFNLSHSLGAVVAGLAIGVPALLDVGAAVDHTGYLVLALAVPPLYLLMSVRYWFRDPTIGIACGTALVAVGVIGAAV